jgi:hypothetical protein
MKPSLSKKKMNNGSQNFNKQGSEEKLDHSLLQRELKIIGSVQKDHHKRSNSFLPLITDSNATVEDRFALMVKSPSIASDLQA